MKTEEEEWGREGEKERKRRTEGGENKERNKCRNHDSEICTRQ